jgi:hypothetical protein
MQYPNVLSNRSICAILHHYATSASFRLVRPQSANSGQFGMDRDFPISRRSFSPLQNAPYRESETLKRCR